MDKKFTEEDVLLLFGRNVKRLRELQKTTQSDLSEYADLSSNFVNEIENVKKGVSIDTIAKLASALKVEPFQLFLPEKLHWINDETVYKTDLDNVISSTVSDLVTRYFHLDRDTLQK